VCSYVVGTCATTEYELIEKLWIGHYLSIANIQLSCLAYHHQYMELDTVINPGVVILIRAVKSCVFLHINSYIHLPSETFLFLILEGVARFGFISSCHVAHIVWLQIVITQQLIGQPTICLSLHRLDIHPALIAWQIFAM
jgi:hypothetical protein